jgi:outer membrane protein assembly factor BamE (lipoprotein component of BamABCDE complex)
MKIAAALAIIFLLNSCNTAIGMWRDTKQGFIWSKNKIQQSRNGGGGNYDPYGAPTY